MASARGELVPLGAPASHHSRRHRSRMDLAASSSAAWRQLCTRGVRAAPTITRKRRWLVVWCQVRYASLRCECAVCVQCGVRWRAVEVRTAELIGSLSARDPTTRRRSTKHPTTMTTMTARSQPEGLHKRDCGICTRDCGMHTRGCGMHTRGCGMCTGRGSACGHLRWLHLSACPAVD
jgi:hypothetical protein